MAMALKGWSPLPFLHRSKRAPPPPTSGLLGDGTLKTWQRRCSGSQPGGKSKKRRKLIRRKAVAMLQLCPCGAIELMR